MGHTNLETTTAYFHLTRKGVEDAYAIIKDLTMTTLKQILADHGPEYMRRFADTMPVNHRKALDAIVHCRTDFFGATVYRCESCGKNHLVYRCCGNRHCPNCQSHKTRKWLENRLDAMLPVHHFMITFTVPESIRNFIRSNQRMAYGAMFVASSQTLKKLAQDKKFIGADLPGGALSKSDQRWHPSRKDFFLPVQSTGIWYIIFGCLSDYHNSCAQRQSNQRRPEWHGLPESLKIVNCIYVQTAMLLAVCV